MLVVKNPPVNAGDIRDPWVGKIPSRKAWQPTQDSYLENPMDRGAWWATVHRVTKSLTRLKRLIMHQTGQVIKYGHFFLNIYLFGCIVS